MEPRSETYWEEHRVDVGWPAERMYYVNEFSETLLPPTISAFARTLVSGYRREYESTGFYSYITPHDFTLNASMLLHDISSKGKGDVMYTRIPEQLLQLNEAEIKTLYLSVPVIASVGFERDFSDAVHLLWNETLKYYGYIDDLPGKTVDAVSPIVTPINTEQEAQVQVFNAAEDVVANLDWDWATGQKNIDEKELRKLYKQIAPTVIAESEVGMKRTIAFPLSEETATQLKDWLCVYALEKIALGLGLDRDDADFVAARLLMANPGLIQSMKRIADYFDSTNKR